MQFFPDQKEECAQAMTGKYILPQNLVVSSGKRDSAAVTMKIPASESLGIWTVFTLKIINKVLATSMVSLPVSPFFSPRRLFVPGDNKREN